MKIIATYKPKSQNVRLLEYLKAHKKGITQLEAFSTLGICRLSERCREIEGSVWHSVNDLDKDYFELNRERVKVRTRNGYAHVTRYSLA